MSGFVSALDKHSTQYGENAHVEYAWSQEKQEKIQQLFFQLTRTQADSKLKELYNIAHTLIKDVMVKKIPWEKKDLGMVLYKMVAQTRDVVAGKGEYTLAYMLLYAWAEVDMNLAKHALKCFVLSEDNTHPLGSWKDMKYFAEYCKKFGENEEVTRELTKYVVVLVNNQLIEDYKYENNCSLLPKWIPREKSRFGWLFTDLAVNYYADWIPAKNHKSYKRAVNKAKTHYRKLIASLNRTIDTPQIKQCGNDWSNIDINKLTSQTLQKQKYALQNIDKKGEQRHYSEDRLACAGNYKKYLEDAKEGKVVMKGKRVGVVNFVKDALEALRNRECGGNIQDTIDTIDEQWKNNALETNTLENFVAMIDTSGSMTCDNHNPLHAAIGLGVRVAEKSTFGKRVMTFSAHPEWVNLDECDSFTSMVDRVKNCNWGMNTNFHAAMKLMLDAIVENRLPAADVKNMVLAVFSDMQIDTAGGTHTMMGEIEQLYADAGRRVCGEPYTPPHILFWNLRSTNGFPTLSTQKNATMFSGFSPALLNLFCEKGLSGVLECTPWNMLVESLNNERYKSFEEKFLEAVN